MGAGNRLSMGGGGGGERGGGGARIATGAGDVVRKLLRPVGDGTQVDAGFPCPVSLPIGTGGQHAHVVRLSLRGSTGGDESDRRRRV